MLYFSGPFWWIPSDPWNLPLHLPKSSAKNTFPLQAQLGEVRHLHEAQIRLAKLAFLKPQHFAHCQQLT